VHPRRRVIRTEQQLRDYLFDTANNRICGFFVSPTTSNPAVPVRNPGHVGHGVIGGGNVITTFQFQIEGFFGIDDANASETVFSDLAWNVCDLFNAYGSIPASGGGAIPGIVQQQPCTIEQFGYILFAGQFLCHYVRMDVAFTGRTRPA